MASCHALAIVRWTGEVSLATRKREPAIELRNHLFRASALLTEGIDNTRRTVMARRVAARRSRENPCERGHSAHENRESPDRLPPMLAGRPGKACGRTPGAHASGKSDIGHSTVDTAEQRPPSGGGGGAGKAR
jgi:hypothetical protein